MFSEEFNQGLSTLSNMILWCKFMNSHKDQTSPQHTQTLGSALASSSSSGSMPLLFLRSLQVLSPHSFPKTYSSSNCKPSFISSAVPALVRGPLSQWRLGAFIFCWSRLTGWRQWSLPGRESSLSGSSTLWLSERRVCTWVSTSPGKDCLVGL